MESQSKPRRSRSRSSSSDEEKKKPQAPPGPPSLHYQIMYQQSALLVTIIECKVTNSKKKHPIIFITLKNLKKADLGGGAPDGIVEVYLLPGNNKPEKTKVVKNSLHPVFNENFRFQVFHWDIFS